MGTPKISVTIKNPAHEWIVKVAPTGAMKMMGLGAVEEFPNDQ